MLVQLQAGGHWAARIATVGADSNNLLFRLVFLVLETTPRLHRKHRLSSMSGGQQQLLQCCMCVSRKRLNAAKCATSTLRVVFIRVAREPTCGLRRQLHYFKKELVCFVSDIRLNC